MPQGMPEHRSDFRPPGELFEHSGQIEVVEGLSVQPLAVDVTFQSCLIMVNRCLQIPLLLVSALGVT